jgi:tetratricopeptide (TPR) repeat protein
VLLLTMSVTYPINRREGAGERIRWSQALVAATPHSCLAWVCLGIALKDSGDPDAAIACYREAVRLDPTFAKAHYGLGTALTVKKEVDAALASLKEAVRLDPTFAPAHYGLGGVHFLKGDVDGATACYRETVRLDPKDARGHTGLGWCLEETGDLDGAIACYKEALRIDPKQPDALKDLPRAERRRDLLARLPGVLAGTDQPANAGEILAFADLCRLPFQKRYAAAARFYEEAFTADPKLGGDSSAGRRYNAACFAALAGRGAGVDAPADERERASLRAKALNWLRADLALRRRQATAPDAKTRQFAAGKISHWLKDPDLAGLRPGLLRIGVPLAERQELDKFWAEVKATLAEANQPPKREVLPVPRAEK